MASFIFAGYALAVLMASNDGLMFSEGYLPQLPQAQSNPAFVEQLPEAAVVPVVPQEGVTKPLQRKVAKPRPAVKTIAVHSIFPSIGAGVNARTDPLPADSRLPTVGGGSVGSL